MKFGEINEAYKRPENSENPELLRSMFDHLILRLQKYHSRQLVRPLATQYVDPKGLHKLGKWSPVGQIGKSEEYYEHIKHTCDQLEEVLNAIRGLIPRELPKEQWPVALELLEHTYAYLQQNVVVLTKVYPDTFSHLPFSDISIDPNFYKDYAHVGGDKTEDMYVHKKYKNSHEGLTMNEIYDAFADITHNIELFEDAIRHNESQRDI